MLCWIGCLCGLCAALAVRGVLLAWMPSPRKDYTAAPRRKPNPPSWEETRNFLYYDGTVMPTSNNKEDINEQ